MSTRPRISLCMIVRNEEKNLADCLRPIRDLFDEMVIVDTGSTDRTKEIAAEFDARVFDFPWCNSFSAARNESLRHATGDWAMWLDADDRIDATNAGRLRKVLATLPSGTAGYTMAVVSPRKNLQPVVGTHCRLFSNLPSVRWQWRAHEQVWPSLQALGATEIATDVEILHIGYDSQETIRRKSRRNLPLMLADLEELPDQGLIMLQIGLAYRMLDEPARGLSFLKQALASRSGIPKHSAPLAFAEIARCYLALGNAVEAEKVCQRGLRDFPNDYDLRGILGWSRLLPNTINVMPE